MGRSIAFNPATPNVAPVLLGNLGAQRRQRVSHGVLGRRSFISCRRAVAPTTTLCTRSTRRPARPPPSPPSPAPTAAATWRLTAATLHRRPEPQPLHRTTAAGGAATSLGTINFRRRYPKHHRHRLRRVPGQCCVQTVSAANGGEFWSVTGTTATLIDNISGGGYGNRRHGERERTRA